MKRWIGAVAALVIAPEGAYAGNVYETKMAAEVAKEFPGIYDKRTVVQGGMILATVLGEMVPLIYGAPACGLRTQKWADEVEVATVWPAMEVSGRGAVGFSREAEALEDDLGKEELAKIAHAKGEECKNIRANSALPFADRVYELWKKWDASDDKWNGMGRANP